jgi:glycosyltransferase involved in cell wall biosynthesis
MLKKILEPIPPPVVPKGALRPRTRDPKSLSIVVPCYNEEEVITETYRRLGLVMAQYPIPTELIFVDDGSKDRTWEMLCEIQSKDPRVKIIRLSANRGHQVALTCGLDHAHAEVVLIMDADLQDPPELLAEMLVRWREGYDVAYGKRTKRQGETASKRFFAFAFYRIMGRLTKLYIPEDTGDFRLMDRCAVDALLKLRERHRFIRGMVSWIGFRQIAVPYERPERFAGETKYPFKKSLLLAIDAITSFSYAPLRMASYLGVIFSGVAFLYIVVVLLLKVLGINFPGYTSIMASILLLGGVQLLVLGIIGEYVGRIFEQGQGRPLYFVDQIHGEPLSRPEGLKSVEA